jgi:hypothetical protein
MHDSQAVKRIIGLLLVAAVAGLVAAGCSEIQPEPDVEVQGELQSPTHEQDALREQEDRGEDRSRR